MGLDFAIDELYATGWSGIDTTGCGHAADGRTYPTVDRVRQEFAGAGFELEVRFVQLFDCHRAEWRRTDGSEAEAVVGQTEEEAAVYALAKLRRSLATVGA